MAYPENLESRFYSFCKRCEISELVLECDEVDKTLSNGYLETGKEYVIRCIHEKVCLSYNKENMISEYEEEIDKKYYKEGDNE